MLWGLFQRPPARRPLISRSTVKLAASTTVIVPGLGTPDWSFCPRTRSNWVFTQTSPTPGTGGTIPEPVGKMSHLACLSASDAAMVVTTASTSSAGSDETPRWPMNGSDWAVTSGTFPAAFLTATTAVMYAWTLQWRMYTPGKSNSADSVP